MPHKTPVNQASQIKPMGHPTTNKTARSCFIRSLGESSNGAAPHCPGKCSLRHQNNRNRDVLVPERTF